MRRANAVFAAHGPRPFFALMLTTSNHAPYEFPADRITLFEQPPSTVHNAIRYADFALGEFFRLARREQYFAETIFLVVADHDTRVYGADLVPIEKFHVPGLIPGPGVPVSRVGTVASQDLLPTLLDLTGLDAEHPMIGRDLLQMASEVPGHALSATASSSTARIDDHSSSPTAMAG